MEIVAKGCWLLQAVALFPEHCGNGYGPALIERACQAARDAGHRRAPGWKWKAPTRGRFRCIANAVFAEWDRQTYVPFPGLDDEGDWILMARDLQTSLALIGAPYPRRADFFGHAA